MGGPGSGRHKENFGSDIDVSEMEQRAWNNFEYGDGDPPTKDNPAIMDEYIYWYGDSDQTSENVAAKAYFHEGTLITEPEDSEIRDMNLISNESVENAIDQVPPVLRQYIEAVQINPYQEADQSARAEAQGNTIIIYGDQEDDIASETEDELPYILNHEAAHLFDQANGRISKSIEYTEAMKSDANHVTDYSEQSMKLSGIGGRVGVAEDFAEAIAKYAEDKNAFKDNFPARTQVIEKYLNQKSFSREEIKGMSTEEYANNRDEIHNALSKGKIK